MDRLARLDQLRQHVRQVQLALGVVAVDLAERSQQAAAVERVHARVDLADLELLGRRVASALTSTTVPTLPCLSRTTRPYWPGSSSSIVAIVAAAPLSSWASTRSLIASRGDQRDVAGEHDDGRVGVDVRAGGRDRVTGAFRLLLDGDHRRPRAAGPRAAASGCPPPRPSRRPPPARRHGPQDQRAAAERVQDLRQRGAHARSFAGGDDDDGGRGHRSHRSIGSRIGRSGGSSNGRTLGFGPSYLGSNPGPPVRLPFESVRRHANIRSCHGTRSRPSRGRAADALDDGGPAALRASPRGRQSPAAAALAGRVGHLDRPFRRHATAPSASADRAREGARRGSTYQRSQLKQRLYDAGSRRALASSAGRARSGTAGGWR